MRGAELRIGGHGTCMDITGSLVELGALLSSHGVLIIRFCLCSCLSNASLPDIIATYLPTYPVVNLKNARLPSSRVQLTDSVFGHFSFPPRRLYTVRRSFCAVTFVGRAFFQRGCTVENNVHEFICLK